jgi:hypothetical protein
MDFALFKCQDKEASGGRRSFQMSPSEVAAELSNPFQTLGVVMLRNVTLVNQGAISSNAT